MVDYTTSLIALINRAIDSVADNIAKDGLKALKQVIDQAGFGDSPYLKDYEVYSYVTNNVITFEIVLSLEAIEGSPDVLQEQMEATSAAIEDVFTRVYRLTSRGVEKVHQMKSITFSEHDARRPARSALRPPTRKAGSETDHRKKSSERSAGHALARSAPRKMSITRSGKISLSFGREVTTRPGGGMVYPQQDFEGIIGQFMDKLKQIISNNFVPELEHIISRYLG